MPAYAIRTVFQQDSFFSKLLANGVGAREIARFAGRFRSSINLSIASSRQANIRRPIPEWPRSAAFLSRPSPAQIG